MMVRKGGIGKAALAADTGRRGSPPPGPADWFRGVRPS